MANDDLSLGLLKRSKNDKFLIFLPNPSFSDHFRRRSEKG